MPLLDESHLAITSAPKTRPTIDGIVQNLLIRMLSTFEPGAVRVHLWDIGQLTAILPDLYPLSRTSALSLYDPGRLEDLLDELAGHIRRIHASRMPAGYTSLREMRQKTGGSGASRTASPCCTATAKPSSRNAPATSSASRAARWPRGSA